MGFSLYNMGFTAGLVGTLVVALYMSYGFVANPVFVWTTGNNGLLGGFLAAIFGSMVLLGFLLDRTAFRKLKTVVGTSGQAPTDFIALAGLGPTLVNMGLCGAVATLYIVCIGGDMNGPVIGAILTIVGFAAFGKHPRNIVPIMLGVFLGSLAKPWAIDDPSIQLAALFGTTLAPIAGRFGWHWGLVAGFVHSSAALTTGPMHAGLNLYNNGLAAGIVASVLVPVIIANSSEVICWVAPMPEEPKEILPNKKGADAPVSSEDAKGMGIVRAVALKAAVCLYQFRSEQDDESVLKTAGRFVEWLGL